MIISPAVQAERQKICRSCEFWRGKCTKFHILTSAAGCPVGKFAALNSLQNTYAPDPSGCTNCGQAEVKELSYSQAVGQFQMEMVMWAAAKLPLATASEYQRRIGLCGKCPHYKWFQCRKCKCLMFAKAKLGTSKCPIGKW